MHEKAHGFEFFVRDEMGQSHTFDSSQTLSEVWNTMDNTNRVKGGRLVYSGGPIDRSEFWDVPVSDLHNKYYERFNKRIESIQEMGWMRYFTPKSTEIMVFNFSGKKENYRVSEAMTVWELYQSLKLDVGRDGRLATASVGPGAGIMVSPDNKEHHTKTIADLKKNLRGNWIFYYSVDFTKEDFDKKITDFWRTNNNDEAIAIVTELSMAPAIRLIASDETLYNQYDAAYRSAYNRRAPKYSFQELHDQYIGKKEVGDAPSPVSPVEVPEERVNTSPISEPESYHPVQPVQPVAATPKPKLTQNELNDIYKNLIQKLQRSDYWVAKAEWESIQHKGAAEDMGDLANAVRNWMAMKKPVFEPE